MLKIVKKWSVKRKSGNGVRVRCVAICDCGNESEYDSSNVSRGNTTRCSACANKSRSEKHTKHGHNMSNTNGHCTKTYSAWSSMKRRCLTDYDTRSAHYQSRGITICIEWVNSFEVFLSDMGEPPTNEHSLDRINNDGNYSKENCRWATVLQQANNKTNNKQIKINGTIKNLCQWSAIVDIKRKTISNRLSRGWSEYDAVMTDVGKKPNK